MKHIFTLIASFLFSTILSAQTWEKQIDTVYTDVFGSHSPGAQILTQSNSGNEFVTVGYTLQGATLISLDINGNINWTKQYAVPSNHRNVATCIVSTSDGGYLVGGKLFITGSGYYAWLMKVDATGNQTWSLQYGSNAFVNTIQPLSDGSYIIGGGINAKTTCCPNGLIMRVSSTGAIMWQKRFDYTNNSQNFSGNSQISSVKLANDGNIYACGSIEQFIGNRWVELIIKLDISGTIIWQKFIDDGFASESAFDLEPTSDNGCIVTGSMTLIKLDVNGIIQWTKDINGDFVIKDIDATAGGYILTGIDDMFGGELALIKVNSNGNIIWNTSFGNYGDQLPAEGGSVIDLGMNGYLIAGMFSPFSGYYLIKTDINGNSGCNLRQNPNSMLTWNSFFTTDTSAAVSDPLFNSQPIVFQTSNLTLSPSDPCCTPFLEIFPPDNYCDGDSVEVSAFGAPDILWSTGAMTNTIRIKANGNQAFYVTGTNSCISITDTVLVTPDPNPTLFISSASDTLCFGDTLLLSASGNGNSYNWHAADSLQAINDSVVLVYPNVTTTYYVTSYILVPHANSCSTTDSIRVVVENCLPASMDDLSEEELRVFPVPSSGIINMHFSKTYIGSTVVISDSRGVVLKTDVLKEKFSSDLSDLSNGIYFIQILLPDDRKIINRIVILK